MKFTTKKWKRMLDLAVTNNEGEKVAKSIKNKDKAIVRYVCGLKILDYSKFPYYEDGKYFNSTFSCFADRAIELGATIEEIREAFDQAPVIPQSILDANQSYVGKKLQNRFVGFMSKAVIDAGYDINFLPHSGYAITYEGRDAMDRNGRKWTIGYDTEIIINGVKYRFVFDAITCEGGGPTSYVIDYSTHSTFPNPGWRKIGKLEFLDCVMTGIKRAA